MVQKLQKRQSSTDLLITSSTTNEDANNQRGKSPLRQTQKEKINRSNSSERRYKLTKKKSSKEKEQLIKGQVLEVFNDAIAATTNNCECPKITVTKPKSKSNVLWKNSKLFDAVFDDDFTLVRKLIIVEELDVNELSPEGNSVLHVASAIGHLDCLELLLECGAKVNVRDANRRTPLEYAVLYGNFDCASLLIENGADATVIANGIV